MRKCTIFSIQKHISPTFHSSPKKNMEELAEQQFRRHSIPAAVILSVAPVVLFQQ